MIKEPTITLAEAQEKVHMSASVDKHAAESWAHAAVRMDASRGTLILRGRRVDCESENCGEAEIEIPADDIIRALMAASQSALL